MKLRIQNIIDNNGYCSAPTTIMSYGIRDLNRDVVGIKIFISVSFSCINLTLTSLPYLSSISEENICKAQNKDRIGIMSLGIKLVHCFMLDCFCLLGGGGLTRIYLTYL